MKCLIFALPTLAALAAADASADSTRRAAICGSRGYDKATEGYYYGTQATYAGCSAQCLNDAKNCKSFSFGHGECNLYTVAVKGNFDVASDSPYAFYDVSCISPTSSTSTTYKTSTTTLKTSTTTTKSITTTATTTTKSSTVTSAKSSTTTAKTTSQSSTMTTAKTTPRSSTTTTKTTASTTKAATTKTTITTTTTTAASSSLAPPCPLPTFVVTDFKYINSSHNCDCAGAGPDIGDGTGCLSDIDGSWCDPRLDPNCTHCGIGVCMTGLGTQPIGYGPADSVTADISNIGWCFQQNPGTTPRRAVGDGSVVRCAGSQIQWVFSGDSTKAKSTAYFDLQTEIDCANGGYYRAYGSGQTAMSCSYDSQNNATCVLDNPSFGVPATSFDNAYYSDGSSNN